MSNRRCIWRRRIAILGLTIASILITARIRANAVEDWFSSPTEEAEYCLQNDWEGLSLSKLKRFYWRWSNPQRIRWSIGDRADSRSRSEPSKSKETDDPYFETSVVHEWWGLKVIRLISWKRESGGELELWGRCATWQIPHWLVFGPMAILSATLLLAGKNRGCPPSNAVASIDQSNS